MSRPTGSIKAELGNAVLDGIRQRGPEAVGLLIVGLARLAIGSLALGVLLGLGAMFGFRATVPHGVGLLLAAALCVWRLAGRARL